MGKKGYKIDDWINTWGGRAHCKISRAERDERAKKGDLVLLTGDGQRAMLAVFGHDLSMGFQPKQALYLYKPVKMDCSWMPRTGEVVKDMLGDGMPYAANNAYFGRDEIVRGLRTLGRSWEIYADLLKRKQTKKKV